MFGGQDYTSYHSLMTHAIIGMCRAGRTCFLKQLLADRRQSGPPERSIYMSFDDHRLAGIDSSQLDALLEEYFRRHPEIRRKGCAAWFLDEIQLVDGWERFVRRVLDSEAIDLVVSGSSAKMLSREIHTSLRGRAMPTVIAPFSFGEVLRHRGEEPAGRVDRLNAAARSAIEKRLREYLVLGGFPEAQGTGKRPLDRATRIALLQGYVDTVLFRDVIERHAVSQVSALRLIIHHALRNPCGNFSAGRLHTDSHARVGALTQRGIRLRTQTAPKPATHVQSESLIFLNASHDRGLCPTHTKGPIEPNPVAAGCNCAIRR